MVRSDGKARVLLLQRWRVKNSSGFHKLKNGIWSSSCSVRTGAPVSFRGFRTKRPLPGMLSISPISSSTRKASRRELRLTPISSMSCRSGGRGSPGRREPALIRPLSSSTTFFVYACLAYFFFGHPVAPPVWATQCTLYHFRPICARLIKKVLQLHAIPPLVVFKKKHPPQSLAKS